MPERTSRPISSRNASLERKPAYLRQPIPARTDVDPSKFDIYHQWSMNCFAKDKLVPSCVAGEAAPATFQKALNDGVTTFIVDKNVDNFTNALVQAAKESAATK